MIPESYINVRLVLELTQELKHVQVGGGQNLPRNWNMFWWRSELTQELKHVQVGGGQNFPGTGTCSGGWRSELTQELEHVLVEVRTYPGT